MIPERQTGGLRKPHTAGGSARPRGPRGRAVAWGTATAGPWPVPGRHAPADESPPCCPRGGKREWSGRPLTSLRAPVPKPPSGGTSGGRGRGRRGQRRLPALGRHALPLQHVPGAAAAPPRVGHGRRQPAAPHLRRQVNRPGGGGHARTGRRWGLGTQFRGGAQDLGPGVRGDGEDTRTSRGRALNCGAGIATFVPGPPSALSGFKQRWSGGQHFIRRHHCVHPTLNPLLPQQEVILKTSVPGNTASLGPGCASLHGGVGREASVGDSLSFLLSWLIGDSRAGQRSGNRRRSQAWPSGVLSDPGPGLRVGWKLAFCTRRAYGRVQSRRLADRPRAAAGLPCPVGLGLWSSNLFLFQQYEQAL